MRSFSVISLFSTLMILLYQTTETKSLDLSEYGLCNVQGDSSECAFACQEIVQGRGSCIFNKCYCTEMTEIGKCEDDNHESCDALCQDMSPDLIGFCMDDQWVPPTAEPPSSTPVTSAPNTVVLTKGECDVATGDIRCRYACGPEQLQPMCISGQCYCTNVGLGSCKVGRNSEGCIAICQHLGKTSKGCFEGECNCD
ncbi:uncharacterized protein BX663DRAFT_558943 [Cokeromyces recurvatus]|uniref:uncharacterized protein n=1 Tax=Cokeromyces recurvatus TaxID=90255 RepID=UPI00221E3D23|nr:uncharacterized protein BX663DRAFT_558943 [Cokeromyces recurvatus]KAI7905531.1 hypothetical protein BX663DRAFT_558943 [Cokeromyces recurvatus]